MKKKSLNRATTSPKPGTHTCLLGRATAGPGRGCQGPAGHVAPPVGSDGASPQIPGRARESLGAAGGATVAPLRRPSALVRKEVQNRPEHG